MSIIDRIANRFRRRQEAEQRSVDLPTEPQSPFEWPNRETRRRMGIRFPIGLTNPQHLGLEVFEEPFVPRYARRHWAALSNLKTRRNRRHRARIMRAVTPLNQRAARVPLTKQRRRRILVRAGLADAR